MKNLIMTLENDGRHLMLALTPEGRELSLEKLAARANDDDLAILEIAGRQPKPETEFESSEDMMRALLEDEIEAGFWTFVPGNLIEMHGSFLLLPGSHQNTIDELIVGNPAASREYAEQTIYYYNDYALYDPVERLLTKQTLRLDRFNPTELPGQQT